MTPSHLDQETEAQIEEIRTVLIQSVKAISPSPNQFKLEGNICLETLIELLLLNKVTRREIAFLIAEALPCKGNREKKEKTNELETIRA